jgi:ribonuclease HI
MSKEHYLVISDGGKKEGMTYGSFKVIDTKGLTKAHEQFTIGLGTNNQSEYIALLNALKWCLENGIRSIVAVTDSRLVVKQVNGDWRCNNKNMKNLCSKVKNYSRKFNSFELHFVPGKYIKQKLGH